MAIVPVSNSRQILEPSSPVQVAGAESVAGVMANLNTMGLGKAIADLGEVYGKTKEATNKYKLEQTVADADLLLMKKATIAIEKGAKLDDETAFVTVERFLEEAKPDVEKLVLERFADNLKLQEAALAGISTNRNKFAAKVLAEATAQRELALKDSRVSFMQKKAEFLRGSPNMLQDVLKEVNVAIMADPQIPEYKKQEEINAISREFVFSAVHGYTSSMWVLGDEEAYARMRVGIDDLTYQTTGIITQEERTKAIKMIEDSYIAKIDTDNKNLDLKLKRVKQLTELKEDNAVRDLLQVTSSSGNSAEAMEAARRQVLSNPFIKTPGVREALLNSIDSAATFGDDATETEFQRRMLKGASKTELQSFITSKFVGQELSGGRQLSLLKQLDNFMSQDRVPSEVRSAISQMSSTIEAYALDVYDLSDPKYSQQKLKSERAAEQFRKMVAREIEKNGTITVDKAAGFSNYVIKNFLKADPRTSEPTGVPEHLTNTPENTKRTMDDMAKQLSKNWNTMTPAEKKRAQGTMKSLNNRLKGQIESEAVRPQPKSSGGRARPFDE